MVEVTQAFPAASATVKITVFPLASWPARTVTRIVAVVSAASRETVTVPIVEVRVPVVAMTGIPIFSVDDGRVKVFLA